MVFGVSGKTGMPSWTNGIAMERKDIGLLALRRLLVLWFAAPGAGDAIGLGNLPNGDVSDAVIVGDGGISFAGRGEDFVPHGLV